MTALHPYSRTGPSILLARVQQDALLSLFAHLEGEALYLARELHDCCPDSIPILQRAEVVDARLNDFAQ